MLRLGRDNLVYGFDATMPPVATIQPGETILVETYDTSTGRIHRPEDVAAFVAARDPRKVNPACGPIFVAGAQPGDALAVTILDIQLAPLGWVRALRGAGVVQDGIAEHGIVMVRVEGDDLIFGDTLRFPARPMVGVIGTAPAEGVVYTAHPGPLGSNIDLTAITTGATVHLPVEVPGGLLAIGDVHASMGEGEVSGTGVEINGEVTVRVDLEPGAATRRIWVETAEAWIATGQGATLDDAVEEAVRELTSLLERELDLSRTEAFLLVSARGDVRVGQNARIPACDATAFAIFPKGVGRL